MNAVGSGGHLDEPQEHGQQQERERLQNENNGQNRQDVVMELTVNFPELATPSRRVSFPNDKELVTGYMEPADPWANGEFRGQFCCQFAQ